VELVLLINAILHKYSLLTQCLCSAHEAKIIKLDLTCPRFPVIIIIYYGTLYSISFIRHLKSGAMNTYRNCFTQ